MLKIIPDPAPTSRITFPLKSTEFPRMAFWYVLVPRDNQLEEMSVMCSEME